MLSDLNSKFDEGMAELASVPAKIVTSKKYLMQLNSIFGRWIRYSPACLPPFFISFGLDSTFPISPDRTGLISSVRASEATT